MDRCFFCGEECSDERGYHDRCRDEAMAEEYDQWLDEIQSNFDDMENDERYWR